MHNSMVEMPPQLDINITTCTLCQQIHFLQQLLYTWVKSDDKGRNDFKKYFCNSRKSYILRVSQVVVCIINFFGIKSFCWNSGALPFFILKNKIDFAIEQWSWSVWSLHSLRRFACVVRLYALAIAIVPVFWWIIGELFGYFSRAVVKYDKKMPYSRTKKLSFSTLSVQVFN